MCVSVWYSVECCFSSVWGERKEQPFTQKPTNHLTEFSTCLFSSSVFCTKVSKPGIFHLLPVIYNFTCLFFVAFFFCISSHFPCSCPLPSHGSLLLRLSSLYPPPRIHTSTCAHGGLALFLSDGWKCQHCEGTEVRTARQPVKLLSCSGLGDWLTGRLQWRGKRSLLALPQMAQYTASCKSRFTYFLCLTIFFFFSLQNFLQDGRK